MKHIINQVYWEQVSSTYMFGTKLQKKDNEVMLFKNRLMPAGKTIIRWSSSLNYQVNKEVPSLPILQNGKKYKINLSIDVEPKNTAIFCLRFFDLQTTEIDNVVFSNTEKTFIYPKQAVSYTFEIINGGCTKIEFSKFQITSANISSSFMDDELLLPISKNNNAKKVAILLILDSKRAREVIEPKISVPKDWQLYTCNIAWQNADKIKIFLKKWIENNSKKEIFIFNSAKRLQDNLSELKQTNSNFIIKDIDSGCFPEGMQNKWFVKDAIRVDQEKLINQILKYFEA